MHNQELADTVAALRGLSPEARLRMRVEAIAADIVATSAIEGVVLDPRQVRRTVLDKLVDTELARTKSAMENADGPSEG